MLLLRMSYLERTVRVEELLDSIGAGASDRGTARASTPASASASTPASTQASTRAASSGRSPGASRASSGPGPSAEVARDVRPPASRSGVLRGPANGTTDPATAWQAYLEAGQGVPPGLGPFLRSATVRAGEGKTFVVELPDGPGLERMSKPAVQAAVSAGLAAHLGEAPVLDVRKRDGEGDDPGSDGPDRVTQETVRDTRLQELIDREPLLEQAVEELDLELLDP